MSPTEKFLAVLLGLDAAGLTFRGINVESFDEWMVEVARGDEEPALGLATMFVPLARVERIFLDEKVGEVRSYQQTFNERTGVELAEYLGLRA